MAKKKKKKSGLNTPMLVISAVALVVFLTFIALTVRNILLEETPKQPEMEDVPQTAIPVSVDYTSESRDLFSDLHVNDGGAEYMQDMLDRFKPLYAANSDTIGYLKVPGTSIDTVVVQSDTDNGLAGSYKYLKNDFYGEFTKYGNVFLDYRCGKYTLSTNTILYGHTTEDGQQVFCDLEKYQDPEFFKKNPIVEYSTLYNTYRWKIFAVFATTVNPEDDGGYVFDYIYPTMSTDDMQGYLAGVKERELYHTGVEVAPTDQILTLSTCSYLFKANGRTLTARLVVVARMLRDGESEAIDPTLVTAHDDYRRPQAWYRAAGQQNPYKDSVAWKPKGIQS
jgi:sortase B